MPDLVLGIRFHQMNLPGPKLEPEHHHVVQAPITVSPEAASKVSARHKAEYQLALAAGNAQEIICTETVFLPAQDGFACVMTGVPIKYLDI